MLDTRKKKSTSMVQRWGNSLAVRIPASVARSVGFTAGQAVEISAEDSTVRMVPKGEPRLTLQQKLERFDPDVHSGEAMVTRRVGKEIY
jgi:antitoxin MazE